MTYSIERFMLMLFTIPIDVDGCTLPFVCCGGCFCGDMLSKFEKISLVLHMLSLMPCA